MMHEGGRENPKGLEKRPPNTVKLHVKLRRSLSYQANNKDYNYKQYIAIEI